jgi:Trk K+ transport system NAD-binding subunit
MTPPRPPIRQRFRYWFDNTLSSGTTAMVVWLTIATILLILVVSLAAAIAEVRADGSELSFGEAMWSTLMRTLDPGTMGGDVGWPLRLASLTATIGGILIVSSLIGLLANGISDRVAELRRGRSPVLETGHTLILGWSPKVFPIVSEITIANESAGGGSVVVLAAMEKDEMERLLDARVAETRGTKIVCRNGVPFEPIDIAIARPEDAKAVVVLNPGQEDGDAEVVKTTLAVLRSGVRNGVPVVAEVGDAFTASALRDGTHGAVSVVRSTSIIARVTAQVCRQPGLSDVYQELFDFDGDEIYFHAVPELSGSTFADALASFEQAVALGVKFRDGRVALNPPHDTVISDGDELVAIAEDDDKIVYTGTRAGRAGGAPRATVPEEAERVLMIGWNRMAPEIVRELDNYVAPGATLTIHVDAAVCPPEEVDVPETRNLQHSLSVEPLGPATVQSMMQSDPPDHVIVLCYKERLSEAQADARVLLTLLHLRSAIDAAGAETNIVAELLDERDVDLTPSRQTDEFIVSERLTALLMAQLSENRFLAPVFDDLLDEAGSEIYLKPADLYAAPSEQTTFADVVASASARGEIALGYQTSANGAGRNVVINPRKSEPFTLGAGDRVIVLSETQD